MIVTANPPHVADLSALTSSCVAGQFGYDAIDDAGKHRRRPTVSTLKNEDKTLNPADRKRLLAITRDLPRNFSVVSWAVRKHLDYVSTFSFQSRTGIKALDRRVEDLVKWWSRRRNCDRAARHNLRRFTRMAETRRALDGDVGLLKLADGRLQGIEGDRVRTPLGGLPPGLRTPAEKLTHGIKCDKAGRALAYCVCKRSAFGGFTFERMIPARHMVWFGYYDLGRFDQIRGISPLASAVNTFKDVYECYDLAKAKAKVDQMLGLIFTRDGDESTGDLNNDTNTEDEEDKSNYEIDMGRGPWSLELEQGDDAKLLTSQNPSNQFQEFCSAMLMAALKALDIPYSFYDEAHTNYSGSRQAWLQYEDAARAKREDLAEMLDEILVWKLTGWILDGTLVLPAGMTIADLLWEWVPRGIPWIQPLQEAKADMTAVDGLLDSRTRICKRRLSEWDDVADEQEYEAARLARIDKIRAGEIEVPGIALELAP